MVLSKIDFYPSHYKIIRKDKKIFIKYHCLIDNKMIYNDETLMINSNNNNNKNSFNGGLKIVNILINLRENEYRIIMSAFHILNTNINFYKELKEKINNPSYYFINNIIDENYNIDYNIITLNNDSYKDPIKYDKYICRNYSILLTDDKEMIYFNSLSNKYNNSNYEPLLSNEIRMKEIKCNFL